MRGHLHCVEPPRGPRRLNSRREIDEWAAERYRTLMALVEKDRAERQEKPAQLELGEAA
jgi:hypothetical protein